MELWQYLFKIYRDIYLNRVYNVYLELKVKNKLLCISCFQIKGFLDLGITSTYSVTTASININIRASTSTINICKTKGRGVNMCIPRLNNWQTFKEWLNILVRMSQNSSWKKIAFSYFSQVWYPPKSQILIGYCEVLFFSSR